MLKLLGIDHLERFSIKFQGSISGCPGWALSGRQRNPRLTRNGQLFHKRLDRVVKIMSGWRGQSAACLGQRSSLLFPAPTGRPRKPGATPRDSVTRIGSPERAA